MLQNERSRYKQTNKERLREINKKLKRYDDQNKVRGLSKPPIFPTYEQLPQLNKNKEDDGQKNSLRRSKTWKSLKKLSETDRASAPDFNYAPLHGPTKLAFFSFI